MHNHGGHGGRTASILLTGLFLTGILFAVGGSSCQSTEKKNPKIRTVDARKKAHKINEPFTVSSNTVVQGKKVARVSSTTNLISNYYGNTHTWTLSEDISRFPRLEAPAFPLLVSLYNMALEEALLDIRKDRCFMAGKQWEGVWTRDISYSIHLSLAILFPEISENSLRKKVNDMPEVIQDTGTGGSWPVSTDRVVWALAAWELYQVHGDRKWLEYAHTVLSNTAYRDRHAAYDRANQLYFGETSFLDWREQSYPGWMDPVHIYESRALNTNILHQRLLYILHHMSKVLGQKRREARQYHAWAEQLKNAINRRFWLSGRRHYAAYLYPEYQGRASIKYETLGSALAILFDTANPTQAKNIMAKAPHIHFGIPCFYPQQPGKRPYHNKGIWPFVEAYHAWAAAKVNNARVAEHILKSMTRATAMFMSHKENFVYDTGRCQETAVNSRRQLWSVAGYLAMVYRVLFGISYTSEGMEMKPLIPALIEGPLKLTNYRYRDARLTITVRGQGDRVRSWQLDGNNKNGPVRISPDLAGTHSIAIEMEGNPQQGSLNMVSTGDVCPEETYLKAAYTNKQLTLRWSEAKDAVRFHLFRNREEILRTTNTTYSEAYPGKSRIPLRLFHIQATGTNGLPSNLSSSLFFYKDTRVLSLEAENLSFPDKAARKHKGFSGSGYVHTYLTNNARISGEFNLKQDGVYMIRIRYANGNGPINTDNKCGIRTLRIDTKAPRVIVLAQRNMWTNWGYANAVRMPLRAGRHRLELKYTPLDRNMNGKVNNAAIDRIDIIRMR